MVDGRRKGVVSQLKRQAVRFKDLPLVLKVGVAVRADEGAI